MGRQTGVRICPNLREVSCCEYIARSTELTGQILGDGSRGASKKGFSKSRIIIRIVFPIIYERDGSINMLLQSFETDHLLEWDNRHGLLSSC